MMNLTARQIKFMDEFSADKRANEETLRVALQFHANRAKEISKTEKEFWDELIELHDLDRNTKWTFTHSDGALKIIDVDDKDT